jgi:hypothetical protein
MSQLLVHNMDTAWTSSNGLLLSVTVDNLVFFGTGAGSNRLVAEPGSQNAFAEFLPGAPLDLGEFEELRFWIRAEPEADGSSDQPFFLEFSYLNAGDAPGVEHRWLVPVNQVNTWEHRRIGIQDDSRNAITSFRFTCLTNLPFACYLDELLAVHEEAFVDLERSLVAELDRQVTLPGLTNLALSQAAAPNDTQIVLPLAPDVAVGNRILVQGGSAGDETHDVVTVNHDAVTNTTTLHFSAADIVKGTLTPGTATVSVIVPALVESPPSPTNGLSPAIILTVLDMREDLDRTAYFTQRDSFRRRGTLVVCSVRPAPRAYLVDYQITAIAMQRSQQILIQTMLLQRLSHDIALVINGELSPVWTLPPQAAIMDRREFGILAPVYVRVGTRMETAPRHEQPWVRHADIEAARLDAPQDQEGLVIEI